MDYIYPAMFYPEEKGFAVVFADMELATQGDTLEQAMIMAEEALTGRIFLMLAGGEKLPESSKVSEVTVEDKGSFVTLIKTDRKYLKRDKCVKKNLTIPKYLADAAERANINFSQVLQEALVNKLDVAL